MVVTYDEILEAETKIERGWEPSPETGEEALQKLGSPERLPPGYILLIAELDKWNRRSMYSEIYYCNFTTLTS
jgi:hypothetical protein